MTNEPTRARAVFSTEDFALIKQAIGEMIPRLALEDARLSRLGALYHRLGRVG